MLEIHNGQNPWKCIACDKFFSKNEHLTRHNLAVHEERKPHMCSICGKAFAEKRNMAKHTILHEG